MPKSTKQKPSWQLGKPRLHETAARSLVTRREEIASKDQKKVRRQLKLSSRAHLAELDALLGVPSRGALNLKVVRQKGPPIRSIFDRTGSPPH